MLIGLVDLSMRLPRLPVGVLDLLLAGKSVHDPGLYHEIHLVS